MKRRTSISILGVALLLLAFSSNTRAQSTNTSSKQETASNELINEMRQLRIAVQQLSVNAYRGQVMVERLRLQQEQVNRLSQELSATRNQIGDIRAEQIVFKTRSDEAEKQKEAGLANESQSVKLKEMLESLKRAEERLIERDGQLSAQLDEERSNLTDLNRRLDALEREMIIKGQVYETQKPEKR